MPCTLIITQYLTNDTYNKDKNAFLSPFEAIAAKIRYIRIYNTTKLF